MKLTILAPAAFALAVFAAPAQAAPHSTTTVTKVHGPMHLLPHHDRKICKTRWVHHKRVKKCYYH